MYSGRLTEFENLLKNLFFRAAIISLLIHLLAFGGWKLGQARGWWRAQALPAWLQVIQKHLAASASNKALVKLLPKPQVLPKREIPMVFVDTDPAAAVATPPKQTKYYSAVNTEAANLVKKVDSNLPQIDGAQDKVIKTTDPSKAQPLQPSPKPEPKTDPAPQPKAQAPEPKPAQPEPQRTQAPGDLAFAKPQDKAQDGTAQTERSQPAHTAPQTPAPTRPRTLEEARRQAGLQGEKMHQEGGVNRLSMNSALDVTRTSFGDYDREFVDAVQQRWYKLLEDREGHVPGKVVVEFRLWYDGRISDMNVVQNEVGELLGLICQKAVLDPAPYKRWPTEMRREINSDYRDVKFTFYYLNQ